MPRDAADDFQTKAEYVDEFDGTFDVPETHNYYSHGERDRRAKAEGAGFPAVDSANLHRSKDSVPASGTSEVPEREEPLISSAPVNGLKEQDTSKVQQPRTKLLAQHARLSASSTVQINTSETQPPRHEKRDLSSSEKTTPGGTLRDELTGNNFINGIESLFAEGKGTAMIEKELQLRESDAIYAEAHLNYSSVPSSEEKNLHQDSAQSSREELAAYMRNSGRVDQSLSPHSALPHINDAYYADLALWLEITGYHNLKLRETRIHHHHERKHLEAEAARISDKLAVLHREEQAFSKASDMSPARLTVTNQSTHALSTAVQSIESPFAGQKSWVSASHQAKRKHSLSPVSSGRLPRERADGRSEHRTDFMRDLL